MKALNEGERGEGKRKLKTQHSKIKIMVSSAITSWQIDGETLADFIFLGSKITTDGDYSHKIKRCLLLGRKAITKLDSILKSRDITLPTKVDKAKATVFPAAMYGHECWTIIVWCSALQPQIVMLTNCDAGVDSIESPGQQGNQTSQS